MRTVQRPWRLGCKINEAQAPRWLLLGSLLPTSVACRGWHHGHGAGSCRGGHAPRSQPYVQQTGWAGIVPKRDRRRGEGVPKTGAQNPFPGSALCQPPQTGPGVQMLPSRPRLSLLACRRGGAGRRGSRAARGRRCRHLQAQRGASRWATLRVQQAPAPCKGRRCGGQRTRHRLGGRATGQRSSARASCCARSYRHARAQAVAWRSQRGRGTPGAVAALAVRGACVLGLGVQLQLQPGQPPL